MTMINKAQAMVDHWMDQKFEERPESLVQFVKLAEELGELADALLKREQVPIKDALSDMLFVLLGIANLEGIDLETGFLAVYESNMTKVRAKRGDRNPGKGDGYVGPRL